MSVTQNWSWIFSMDSSLYNQLRTLIYSKIVPTSTVTTYGDDVITLNFNPLRTTLTLSTDQQDVIELTASINGNIQPNSGVQVSFNGTVTALIDLDKVYIKGDGSQANTDGEQGISWTNYLYLETGAVSGLTVDAGDDETNTMLTNFMQSNIETYVANSPHSLGETTSTNLDPYFVPTYQKFITLTDSSNDSNPRVIQLVMVNNEEPPTGDPHEAFEETATLDFPEDANAVFAFNDYTIFGFMATKMEANENNIFSDISVSQDPAVLTAKGKKKDYSLTLTSQIKDDAMSTELKMTNAIKASFTYDTSLAIENEDDGSQTLVVANDLSKSNTGINGDNATVIALQAVYYTLLVLSPLSGIIYYSVMKSIEQRIISMLNRTAGKLEFEDDISLKSGSGNVGVNFKDITMDEGIIISAKVSVSNTDSSQAKPLNTSDSKRNKPLGFRQIQNDIEVPKNISESFKNLSKNLDNLHDTLVAQKFPNVKVPDAKIPEVKVPVKIPAVKIPEVKPPAIKASEHAVSKKKHSIKKLKHKNPFKH